jgi:alkanesulfonate monooxygenase SsuD/methylene tetrahydromethanopterin reductase-like flavin-dependent oxidoreductase (luciferase family)
MQFGIFYEHQLPRPWGPGDEHRLLKEALEQVALADRLGFHYAWEVEHHFLEEYSHSSAPEVFLAACSQLTSRIRLGHGITLMAPNYNHPARVAERIATLDLISDGRVEWGTGESSSRLELEGFGIDPQKKRMAWHEAVRETARMMVAEPYPGFDGEFFRMPHRNVVPKPLQKPHPPLWLACSNRDTIKLAARLGMGALTFAFVDPSEARFWVEEYHEIFARECEPIGQDVNPRVAMVTGFSLHEDAEIALDRGIEGFRFFSWALAHMYLSGSHVPGRFDLWEAFRKVEQPSATPTGGIGDVAQVRATLECFEDVGVDQVIFIQQAGNNRHEDICASMQLFAERLLPEFEARHPAAANEKATRLAPAIERARAKIVPPVPMSEVEPVDAYPVMVEKLGAQARTGGAGKRLRTVAEGAGAKPPPDD